MIKIYNEREKMAAKKKSEFNQLKKKKNLFYLTLDNF